MDIRLFVEKKEGFRVEAESLRQELNENLQMHISKMRYLCVYDLFGFSEELLAKSKYGVFGETVTDVVYDRMDLKDKNYLAVEYIPGQFDQRASSAIDCVHLIDPNADIDIRSSRLLIFEDEMTADELERIRHYYINSVESREKNLQLLERQPAAEAKPLASLHGFTSMPPEEYEAFCQQWGLAMNADDLKCVADYFRQERRDPTETELRILDTYWSDHCRHTTFTTILEQIEVEDSFIKSDIENELARFNKIRVQLHRADKPLCLMEIATIGARYLRQQGLLDDWEVSEENNACSIFIDVDVDGKNEQWLLQFKNETHNHPTEIEPFGGASTCLGGAIRDPLSGRAYVYQAMRVTGAGDIYAPVSATMAGKLPQQLISRKAAAGYSSYGNQIGLATTHVREIYHPSYVAKRLEVGAVVGAVKADSVRRESPVPGDVILLLGGRTGRDGIGGATGSSKEHTEASLEACGSEVQKGNAPEERKIQRLFRRKEVTRLIKKSNDFGAGGVSVAIGELADGLDIFLDRVPTKYSGLNPTELAISESQERMAVVVEKKDQATFELFCRQDNIEVTHVANVTDTGRMRLYYKGDLVADLSRAFINSAGAKRYARAAIAPVERRNPFRQEPEGETLAERIAAVLRSPNVTSQKGLVEQFDASIGRSSVLMPFGGKLQRSETQASVQKLPTDGFTNTASALSFGFNPFLSEWSPYHGAAYAVVEACTKAVAVGADYSSMRFSYQEYFERMTDSHSWGKPLSALLGALKMQLDLGLPSIGGKDSMSGTFEHISVPPTLIAFGITTVKADRIISSDLKKAGNRLYLLPHKPLANHMPNVAQLRQLWSETTEAIHLGRICSACSIGFGGLAEALCKMSFGNDMGVDVHLDEPMLFDLHYGSILAEATEDIDITGAILLGCVTDGTDLIINGEAIDREFLYEACTAPFDKVYPSYAEPQHGDLMPGDIEIKPRIQPSLPLHEDLKGEPPVVYIPVFPGTNCDFDSAKAWRKAGAKVEISIFRNLTDRDVVESIDEMKRHIRKAQILMLAGGFSSGDEPDGSAKFIVSVLSQQKIRQSIEDLLHRGGLILGICNGFQALIKSGLLPYGRFGQVTTDSPTLFRNDINRHVSQMVTTTVTSVSSPWLKNMSVGDLHSIAVSHGEGKLVVSKEMAHRLFENGQVAFRYADPRTGLPTMQSPYNPNGSCYAIEGLLSPNGQILGKMGHTERWEENVFVNIAGNKRQQLFENAVNYFNQ